LENELDLSVVWLDSTCLKACIHFPADWVLLRDLVRTLSKSILTIRRHGLRHRIGEPEEFLRAINAQSMAMAEASRRKPGGKKERKRVLRVMKRICKTVLAHARRYRRVLDANWQESDLSRKEAEVILRRMDNVLDQAPAAIKQAHERIIGERAVDNADKILSLCESDLHVIVRRKAGAEVESSRREASEIDCRRQPAGRSAVGGSRQVNSATACLWPRTRRVLSCIMSCCASSHPETRNGWRRSSASSVRPVEAVSME
jgi:hypothetical protein